MKVGFSTLVLGFLVLGILGGVAFGGGVIYGRQHAPLPKTTSAAVTASVTPVGAQGASPTPGAGGRGNGGSNSGFNAANFVSGAVDSVNGSTLVIRMPVGTVANVKLAPSTRVESTVSGSQTDLKPGAVVCVQGTPDSSGALTANTIDIAPSCGTLAITGAGATGSAGGSGGGGRGGAQGTPGARPQATP